MDETFDFVIVGSGGGSMSAALLMRSAGKSVVILEKTELFGGTTATSGGVMWIPNNRFMRADGIEDSTEKAMAYLTAVVGDRDDQPGATPARRLAYIEQSNAMLDFLISQGIPFKRNPSWPDYYDAPGSSAPGRTVSAKLYDSNRLGEWKALMRPFPLPVPAYIDEAMRYLPHLKRTFASKMMLAKILMRGVGAKLTGKTLVSGGNALQGRALEAALKAGVDIRLNSPVKRIIMEGDRAEGVTTEKDGTEHRIHARLGILINAGGFAHNQRMRDQYSPGMSADRTNAAPGDTGEMIEEGARAGGALAQMDAFIGGQVSLPPGGGKPMMQGDMSKPHSIVVDQTGVRYARESGSYNDFCNAALERDKTVPAVPSWMILDSQYPDMMASFAASKKPESWYEEGFAHRGDTVEELAASLKMDPATLRATIDRFNGFVRNGRDEDFHRGESVYDKWLGDPIGQSWPALGTIEKGPFHALPIYPGDVSTYGGLVTDEYARVLREDGSVIPGLYATGSSTASVMGRSAPAAGVGVGPSFTWGYVAAKHAANLDNAATGAR